MGSSCLENLSTKLHRLAPTLRELLGTQRYAVLGTSGEEGIRLNLMAVAVTDDLRSLIMATERATHKYANLLANLQVCLLMDNRANDSGDTQSAIALTIDGVAAEAVGPARVGIEALFLARHPQMLSFLQSPTCALFRVRVTRYELVRGLHEVEEVQLG